MNEIQEISERAKRLAAGRIIDIVREIGASDEEIGKIREALEEEADRLLREQKTYSCEEVKKEFNAS